MTAFDTRSCTLGEGPLWHPQTETLYWFDILNKQLCARKDAEVQSWDFDEHISAAGWIDEATLLVASETALLRFDTQTGDKTQIIPLEADRADTRSNDGRADPWGGFWIGTMGKKGEPGAGAIYRYYRGVIHEVVPDISISNAICFAPDRSCAYYSDTATQTIMRQPLVAETGWPDGVASVFVDLTETSLHPDGAMTDTAGNLWVAMWGAACVICYGPDGKEQHRIDVPAIQPTCPAFGGPELRDLYVTSATFGLDETALQKHPLNGATFVHKNAGQGLPEPQVIL